jgi:SNF2 family DNA or RNA helicase
MDTSHISRDRIEEQHAASTDLFELHFDQSLLPFMRPHQIAAARFLLLRLLGEDHSSVIKQSKSQAAGNQGLDIPLTGAILADDVGTGKTLSALSVLWALCRNGKGKGVIVCPSSLVENWRKEITRWFPKTLARSALFITGSNRSSGPKVKYACRSFCIISTLTRPHLSQGTDAMVSEFISSHPAIHPVLVLSYDMFRYVVVTCEISYYISSELSWLFNRIYSDFLNDMTCLNTIVCDEGHR